MQAKKLISAFGSQSALAAALGVRQSTVSYWNKAGEVPEKWIPKIREAAKNLGIGLEDQGEFVPFIFYRDQSGKSECVKVFLAGESVWASQAGIADIFDTSRQMVSYHITNIFNDAELDKAAVVKEVSARGADGKHYSVEYYGLDMILSVGYRTNSVKAVAFRKWANEVLRNYLLKGFALDEDRLKQGRDLFGKDYFDELLEKIREIRASERRFYQKITDIYSQCSVDYDKDSPITRNFFATVQDKLHYAIHGHTAAELIALRADASKPHMGLTSWKNKEKLLLSDALIAKNYLTKEELSSLNRLVSMFLDFAENQAKRRILMKMEDWVDRLDAFLEFNGFEVLQGHGKVQAKENQERAKAEFVKFRVKQDKEFVSDYDEFLAESQDLFGDGPETKGN